MVGFCLVFMNLLLIFRPINTSTFVDSSFKTDTETQDPCLSLLGEKKNKQKKPPEVKKFIKVGS